MEYVYLQVKFVV